MKKRRKPMQPVEEDGITHRCSNADFFPPPEAQYLSQVPEDLRYSVPDLVYQRLKTWQQVCGLLEMDLDKCVKCPHLLVGDQVRSVGTGKTRSIHTKRKRRIQMNKG